MVTINNSIKQRVRKAVRLLADKQAVVAVYIFGSQVNGLSRGTPARNAIRHGGIAGGLAELGQARGKPLETRGKPDKWSDIDVAIFMEGAEKMGLHRRAQLSAMIQKEAGDDLELHFFTKDMFDHPAPASFAKFVMTKGIHLT